jgi:hypothetical protein
LDLVTLTLTPTLTLALTLNNLLLTCSKKVTDVMATVNFAARGETGFATAMVAMLTTSMLVQMLLVFGQYHRMGPRVLMLELLLTVTCLAPGVHAYRVARSHEKHGREAVTAITHMIVAKGCELVFEAVPGEFSERGPG